MLYFFVPRIMGNCVMRFNNLSRCIDMRIVLILPKTHCLKKKYEKLQTCVIFILMGIFDQRKPQKYFFGCIFPSIFLFTFFMQKMWKSVFQPVFWMLSTQTLVKIYNKQHSLLKHTGLIWVPVRLKPTKLESFKNCATKFLSFRLSMSTLKLLITI